jgi:putative transposase
MGNVLHRGEAFGWRRSCVGRRFPKDRAEISHQSFRRIERAMIESRSMRSLQKFASVQASVFIYFSQERSLSSRSIFKLNRNAALSEWRGPFAA